MCTPSRRLLSRTFNFTWAAAVAAVFALAGTASADEVFKATKAITLPDGQNIVSFDISFVDPVLKLYILGDRTNKAVDVVDTDNNKVVAQVGKGLFTGATGNNDTSGPDGVMFVDQKEIWAGDGDSTLKIFSWPAGTLIKSLSTGGAKRVDEMCFDPVDHLAMAANNADDPPFVTIISSTTHSIVPNGKIIFDGSTTVHGTTPVASNGIEQCQWNPRTGKFYISVPEISGPNNPNLTNSVAGGVTVIDPKTLIIEKTFVIDHAACAGPQGMAVGPDNQILLGCNAPSGTNGTPGNTGNGNFSTVVINDAASAFTAINNESGADEVWFNPGDNHYFLARSSAAGPAAGGHQQLGVIDAVSLQVDQSIPTVRSAAAPLNAHSVAADPNRNQVYVPIPGANAANPNGAGTVCSSVSVPGHKGSDTQGCIAIFTTHNDDRPSVARERQPDEHQE